CDADYCPSGRDLAIPDGYERVSDVLEWQSDTALAEGQELEILVPLEEAVPDGRNVSFFRYVDETGAWEPIAGAVVDESGSMASARISASPQYITVMRRLSAAGHVIAYLPPKTEAVPSP